MVGEVGISVVNGLVVISVDKCVSLWVSGCKFGVLEGVNVMSGCRCVYVSVGEWI